MDDNEHSEIFSDENSEEETGALIVAPSTGIDADSDSQVSNAEQPSIETLTAEIKMYLHIANQSIIEVGKRLIQAKEMLPHGEWLNWLKNNFNLKERMARNFMEIFRRFSNRQSIADFDISTFNTTQLITLLALPEGDEQNFLALKSAEGTPADQMTIKELRDQVAKYKKEKEYLEGKTSHFERRVEEAIFEMEKYRRQSEYLTKVADALQEQSDEYKAKLEQRPTVAPPDYDDLKREVQELRDRPLEVATEFPADYEATKQKLAQLEADKLALRSVLSTKLSLENFLKSLPAELINADNLQSVVYFCAHDNLQDFEQQLSQLSLILSLLQQHLNTWKNEPVNKLPIDRNSITQDLMNICIADPTNSVSKQFRQLILDLGFNELNEIPDDLLPELLKKARTLRH